MGKKITREQIVDALQQVANLFVIEIDSQAADLIDTLQQRNAALAATVIEVQSLCNLEDAYDAVDRIQEICKAVIVANGDGDVYKGK